jgi:hypothetical protein
MVVSLFSLPLCGSVQTKKKKKKKKKKEEASWLKTLFLVAMVILKEQSKEWERSVYTKPTMH